MKDLTIVIEAHQSKSYHLGFRKILNLRVFSDENRIMNLSVKDIDGDIIVVSQFTLHASTKKGNSPSYIKASKPEIAIPVYENFV